MWSTLLEGKHISSDVALIDGTPQWWRHAGGIASGAGPFTAGRSAPKPSPLSGCAVLGAGDISGLHRQINLETIAGRTSRRTCALPISGPPLRADGSTRWSASMPSEWRFDRSERGTATASCFSFRTATLSPSPPAEAATKRQACQHSRPADHLSRKLPPGRHAMPPALSCRHHQLLGSPAGDAARQMLRAHFEPSAVGTSSRGFAQEPANRLTMNSTSATTKSLCAMPVAVEQFPPKPNTAATSEITRNISPNTTFPNSSSFAGQRPWWQPRSDKRPGNPRRNAAFPPKSLKQEMEAHESELTPVEARSGRR